MYSTIMVPLDGSDLAEQALPFAIRVAKDTGGRLILVRAVRGGGSAVATAEHYLKGLAGRLRALGIELESHVYSDDATTAIVHAAQLRGPAASSTLQVLPHRMTELIFIATHARTGMAAILHKSVSESVLAQAEMPVMIIPPQASPWPADKPISILVAIDGSALSEVALATAAHMAQALRAELTVLQVVEADGDEPWEAAKEYLETAVGKYVAAGTSVEQEVTRGQPERVISEAGTTDQADMIVLATHGKTGQAQSSMGRVAKAVLHSATVPIILVRPTELQFARAQEIAVANGS